MRTIGASFSGGGFRATAFTMGCLDYLNSVKLGDRTLLHNIAFSSSTSGGSIAMALHAVHAHNGMPFPAILKAVREHMTGEDLLAEAFRVLEDDAEWAKYPTKNRNLINAFAIVYDQKLFKGATLDLFANKQKNPPIERYCFNTTELNNGVSFRFDLNGTAEHLEDVGNFYQHFAPGKEAVLGKIRLADVVAASSCFPVGFEPLVYPDDLEKADPVGLKDALVDEYGMALRSDRLPFGLIDGGAVDNQGLWALKVEAERRVKRNEQAFDLLISCDVSSFRADRYTPPNGKVPWRGLLRLGQVPLLVFLSLLSLLVAMVSALIQHHWVVVAALVLPTFLLCYAAIKVSCLLGGGDGTWGMILKKYGKPMIKRLSFGTAQYLVQARLRSLGMLLNHVFMNQIRRQHYGAIYDKDNMEVGIISCMVYELATRNNANLDKSMTRKRDRAKQAGHADLWDMAVASLHPTPAMQKVAESAASIETTLWFDPASASKLDDLIACGRFTMCFNLLVYLAEVEAKTGSLDEGLSLLRVQLTSSWNSYIQMPMAV